MHFAVVKATGIKRGSGMGGVKVYRAETDENYLMCLEIRRKVFIEELRMLRRR